MTQMCCPVCPDVFWRGSHIRCFVCDAFGVRALRMPAPKSATSRPRDLTVV